MSLVVQIRGAMGSGKTTLMRSIMAQMTGLAEVERRLKPKSSRPEAYAGTLLLNRAERGSPALRTVILGPYTATCGGMDAVNSVDDSLELIDRYAKGRGRADLVLYEGMMLGHIYGRHGAAMIRKFKQDHVFTFLTTPLDLCIARVRARRAERGATSETFDAKNVVQSHETVESSRLRILENGGRVVMLPHSRPKPKLMGVLREHFGAQA